VSVNSDAGAEKNSKVQLKCLRWSSPQWTAQKRYKIRWK